MSKKIDDPEIDEAKRKTLRGALVAMLLPVAAKVPLPQGSPPALIDAAAGATATARVTRAAPAVLETLAKLVEHLDITEAVNSIEVSLKEIRAQRDKISRASKASGQHFSRAMFEDDLERFFHKTREQLAAYYRSLQITMTAKDGIAELHADAGRIHRLGGHLNYLKALKVDDPINEDNLSGLREDFIESHKAYIEGVEQNLVGLEQKYGVDRDTLYAFANNSYQLGYPVPPERELFRKIRNVVGWYDDSHDLEDLRSLYDRHMDWNSTIGFFTSELKQQIIDSFMFSVCGESSDGDLWSGYTSHEINPPNFCARLNIPQQIRAYEHRHADIALEDLITNGHPGRSEKLSGIRVPFCPDLNDEEREEYFLEGVKAYAPQWKEHYEEIVNTARERRAFDKRAYDHVPGCFFVKYHPFPEVNPDRLDMMKALLRGAEKAVVSTLAEAAAQEVLQTASPDPEPGPASTPVQEQSVEAEASPALLTHEPVGLGLPISDPRRPAADPVFARHTP